MKKLPNWFLTNPRPANYDSESLTVIEQTARLYAAMNELIEEYNETISALTKRLEEYESGLTEEMTTFAVGLRQEFQDFIDIAELKFLEYKKD